MNWTDEGALYSQIAVFLREDLGRGDITTQSIVARNTRARARFIAGEKSRRGDVLIAADGVRSKIRSEYFRHPGAKSLSRTAWRATDVSGCRPGRTRLSRRVKRRTDLDWQRVTARAFSLFTSVNSSSRFSRI